ncbi:MAG: ABC transporter permease [Eubacteriales bacterium]
MRKLISVGLLLLLAVLFTLTTDTFLSTRNLFSILREAGVVGIAAVGVTFVIITAGIDLSTGSMMAVVAMACADMIRFTPLPLPVILLLGCLVGVLCGYINGLIITKLHVPDFIAVLATMNIYRGLTLMITMRDASGFVVTSRIQNRAFLALADDVGGLYFVTIAFFLMAIVGHILLKHTKFGTYTYAVGSNLKSAILSGINVSRIKQMVYALSGFCCGLGAIFTSARMGTATPELGTGFEFDVIAAVVVGGCSFSGGRGDIVGTVIGTLFMAVLNSGIYKLDIPTAYQYIIKGLIIMVVVIFDAWYQRMYEKRLKSRPVEEEAAVGGASV